VDDTLGDGFLTVHHYVVHELGQQLASKFRIRQDLTFGNDASSWHRMCSSYYPRGGNASGYPGPGPALLILPGATPGCMNRVTTYFFGRLAPYLERRCLRS